MLWSGGEKTFFFFFSKNTKILYLRNPGNISNSSDVPRPWQTAGSRNARALRRPPSRDIRERPPENRDETRWRPDRAGREKFMSEIEIHAVPKHNVGFARPEPNASSPVSSTVRDGIVCRTHIGLKKKKPKSIV